MGVKSQTLSENLVMVMMAVLSCCDTYFNYPEMFSWSLLSFVWVKKDLQARDPWWVGVFVASLRRHKHGEDEAHDVEGAQQSRQAAVLWVLYPWITGLWGHEYISRQIDNWSLELSNVQIKELARNSQDTFAWCCRSVWVLEGQFTKGKKEALTWVLQHCSLLKLLPFCNRHVRALNGEQGVHISPGTHSNLHNEDGSPATKQWNTSLPVPPNIPVLIKSIDKHYLIVFYHSRRKCSGLFLFAEHWDLDKWWQGAICVLRDFWWFLRTPTSYPPRGGGGGGRGIPSVFLGLSDGSSSLLPM